LLQGARSSTNGKTGQTDELEDPNAEKYFFEHLQKKKQHLLSFTSDDGWESVRGWLMQAGLVKG
jgi:hypothetical protein